MTGPTSVWLADCQPVVPMSAILTDRNAVRGTDVLVIGAGITGLLVAMGLAESGMSVTIVDAGPFGENTSTHSTVKLTAAHGTTLASISASAGADAAIRYGEANAAGLTRLRELIDRYDISCDLTDDVHYVYTARDDGQAALVETARLSERAGIPAIAGGDLPIPVDATSVLRHEGQALVQPAALINGLAASCAALGAWFLPDTSAQTVESVGVSLRVGLSDGSFIIAGYVVQATHMPFLNRGGAFARLVPRRAYALAGPLPPGARAGTTYTPDDPSRSTRVVQRDGRSWLVAVGEHEAVGRDGPTHDRAARLAQWAREVFDVTDVGFSWSAQDLHSADHLPMVGQVGSDTRILMATGFGGWGYTNAAAAADVLHSLVTGSVSSPWVADWDPRRYGLPASLPDLVASGAAVAGCFIGDRVRSLSGADGATLAAGQSDIRREGRRTIARYRDPGGKLHEVDAKCTHLGCLVRWNSEDVSWDCPCHGSRFSIAGDVIEGPAHTPLQRITP